MLRELADVTAKPLFLIFESSWRTGEVPGDWRKVSVNSVLEMGKKEGPGNYKAITASPQSLKR